MSNFLPLRWNATYVFEYIQAILSREWPSNFHSLFINHKQLGGKEKLNNVRTVDLRFIEYVLSTEMLIGLQILCENMWENSTVGLLT